MDILNYIGLPGIAIIVFIIFCMVKGGNNKGGGNGNSGSNNGGGNNGSQS